MLLTVEVVISEKNCQNGFLGQAGEGTACKGSFFRNSSFLFIADGEMPGNL
jgi:hypothetical protein